MNVVKSCICDDKDKKNWIVIHYRHNHSAFEAPKYGEHFSQYSTLMCEKCGMIWRTKARYVDQLSLRS